MEDKKPPLYEITQDYIELTERQKKEREISVLFLRKLKALFDEYNASFDFCAEYDGSERYCGSSAWIGGDNISIEVSEHIFKALKGD